MIRATMPLSPCRLVEAMYSDFRQAVRQLTLAPGYSIVCILALALGIGAASTAFTAFNAVLLKPIPLLRDADSVVSVSLFHESQPDGAMGLSHPDYVDLNAMSERLEGVVVHQPRTYILTDREQPERLLGSSISARTFGLLGVKPILGRDFLPEEETETGPVVALLGYDVWMRRYGGDTNLVGKTVPLSGQPATVVGVMPPGWRYPEQSDLWTPLRVGTTAAQRGVRFLGGVARIRPGVGMEEAERELMGVMGRLAKAYPESSVGMGVRLTRFRAWVARDSSHLLRLMLGSVLGVQLIACANVANLVLARGTRRMREVVVRVALGASAWHILRWLVCEVLVLGGVGSVLGILLTLWGAALVKMALPPEVPFWLDLTPDSRVIGFAVMLGMGSAVLAGLVPALQLSRPALAADMKALGRGTVGAGRYVGLRHSLVVFEVALAVVLLAGAGLLVRSFHAATTSDPGFDARGVLTFRVGLPPAQYTNHADYIRFFDGIRRRLAELPGVAAAGGVSLLPASGNDSVAAIEFEGKPVKGLFEAPHAQACSATPGGLEALRVPLRQGRYFAATDRSNSLPVALVDESFARVYFPGESALLKRFRPFEMPGGETTNEWVTIVGVVGSVVAHFEDVPPMPLFYMPHAQGPAPFLSMAVRTEGAPERLADACAEAVFSVDGGIPIYHVQSMESVLAKATWDKRFFGAIFASMAGLAVFLAMLGIYGVMTYAVSTRTQEIGVRVALGATSKDVLRLVVKQGVGLVAAGLVVGVVSAVVLARLLQGYLYGVSPYDLRTFVAVPLFLAGVGMLACLVPARRAVRVDPLAALRSE